MTALSERFSQLLTKPVQGFDQSDKDFLQDVVEHYPYFQAARFLLVKNMQHEGDLSFKSALPQLSLLTYNRSSLFAQLTDDAAEESAAQPEVLESITELPSLRFKLSGHIENSGNQPLVERTDELFEYRPTQEYNLSKTYPLEGAQDISIKRRSLELIDKFLEKDTSKMKPNKEQTTSPITDRSLDNPDDLVSETLAKIYAKQGKYKDAIKVYKRLSLLEPEKKATFAGLIEELKKKDQ